MLQQFTQSVGPDKRKAAWSQLQEMVYLDVPVIKLGDYYLLNVTQSWVKGFVNTPNLFFWNVSLSRRS